MTAPGSVFGLTVTSCDEDFLGIRNSGAAAGVGTELFRAPVVGLVSFDASMGGDVTCGLAAGAPVGIERARFFSTSFTVGAMLLGAVAVAVAVAVVAVTPEVADADDGSWPE